MPKITPWLWFDGKAEEAARFYVSVFPNSRVGEITRYSDASLAGEDMPPPGSVMTVEFWLDGMQLFGLNGGPQFPFTEAVSLQIECADQAEVDRYWDALLQDGGQESQCGWLKDRYGFNWQVVPKQLMALQSDPDPAVRKRVNEAMFKMRKLDIAALEAAARRPGPRSSRPPARGGGW